MQIQYPAVLVRLRSGYGVYFPDLPDCQTGGPTQAEAAANAERELLARLELMAARGQAPPEPTPLDALELEPNEAGRLLVAAGPFGLQRINLSLEGPLLARLDAAARRAGLNRSQFLAEAARRLCDASDAGEVVAREPAQVRSARAYLARTARERGLSVEALMAQGRAYGAKVSGGG